MSGLQLSFVPPGPVAGRFYAEEHPVMAIMGPVGGGKTTAALMKLLLLATRQPVAADGTRYFRAGVFRDTYRNLANTALKSWHQRVPATIGRYRSGGMNAPTVHELEFKLLDGSIVSAEFIFAAIGDNNVEAFCRGFELTVAYLNEADLLPEDFLVHLPGRLRYPGFDKGGIRHRGLILDFNAPDTENYLYRDFVDAPREGYKLYVQPSALSAQAENIANLPADYYARAMSGQPDWWTRRFIRNEWGYSRQGKPVYPEYSDQWHVASTEFGPIKGLPIIVGGDGGMTFHPAAVFMQVTSMGQLRVFDELVGEEEDAGQFADSINRLMALCGYDQDWELFGEADPAALIRSGVDKSTWLATLKAKTKIKWRTAQSNDLDIRLQAVRSKLTRSIGGGEPAFLLSPRCKMLRKGFNSLYRFAARKDGQRSDAPEKNHPYSDLHDGLQYACMRAGGGVAALIHGEQRRRYAEAPWVCDDFDPLAY